MKAFVLSSFLSFFIASGAQAGALLQADIGYFSDSLTAATTDTSNKTLYGFSATYSISKVWWGGWSYTLLGSTGQVGTTSTSLSGMATGPTFKYQFGKGRNYSFGVNYNILTTTSYSNGTTSEDWTGTSYIVQLAAMPEISEGFHVGFAFNYFSASYSKRKVSNVESAASYTRSVIFPTFSLSKEF